MKVKQFTLGSAGLRLIEKQPIQCLSKDSVLVAKRVRFKTAVRRQKNNFAGYRCYKHQKLGHIARKCTKEEPSKNKQNLKELKLRISVRTSINRKTEFIFYLGPSQRITNGIRSFTSLGDVPPISFHLADDRILQAKTQGTVLINLYWEIIASQTALRLMLTKVLYNPRDGVSKLSCIQLF